MGRRDMLAAAVVASVWGFNFVVIDWGLSSAGASIPPLTFAAIRFAVVAIPACFFVPRPAVPWRSVVAVGIFMSLGQFALLYVAMAAGMPPGLAALVIQSQPVFTILIAAMALSERPTRAQLIGVGLGSLGLLVVGIGRGGQVALVPVVLTLLAGLSWAIGNVVSRASKSPGGLGLTVWSATVVPLPLLGLSLIVDGAREVGDGLASFGWQAVVSTLYTGGLASLAGYSIFNTLLARNPSSYVVPWVLLSPPVAIVSAWICFGEVPSGAELAGGALVLAGVLIAQGAARRLVRRAPWSGAHRVGRSDADNSDELSAH